MLFNLQSHQCLRYLRAFVFKVVDLERALGNCVFKFQNTRVSVQYITLHLQHYSPYIPRVPPAHESALPSARAPAPRSARPRLQLARCRIRARLVPQHLLRAVQPARAVLRELRILVKVSLLGACAPSPRAPSSRCRRLQARDVRGQLHDALLQPSDSCSSRFTSASAG